MCQCTWKAGLEEYRISKIRKGKSQNVWYPEIISHLETETHDLNEENTYGTDGKLTHTLEDKVF